MAHPGVKVIDHGFKKVIAKIRDVADGYVTVGVQGDNADKTYPDGMTLANVAAVNEFGSEDGRIPERSFIRSTMDEQKQEIGSVQLRAFASVVAGQRTVDDGLGLIGAFVQGKIQEKIASGVAPPNAPATIARKGSSTPLVDSGQLRQGVTYEVHHGGRDGREGGGHA